SSTPCPTSVCASCACAAPAAPARARTAARSRRAVMSDSAPLTTKPISGSSAMAQSSVGSKWSTLPPKQVEVLHVHALDVAENRDDERQSDGGLGGGDGHHEEHEYLAVDADAPRERDEREIDGVQHQFDAEERDDRIAADDDAGDADREQDAGERERH